MIPPTAAPDTAPIDGSAASAAGPPSAAHRPPRAPARLPKRADFLRLAAGRKVVTPGFILQVAPAPDGAQPLRVGLTASRKVGGAVQRNRARRRLRALARDLLPTLARADFDYVLVARRDTASAEFARMADDLARALRRLKVGRPA